LQRLSTSCSSSFILMSGTTASHLPAMEGDGGSALGRNGVCTRKIEDFPFQRGQIQRST
jgi:hypothetical protein